MDLVTAQGSTARCRPGYATPGHRVAVAVAVGGSPPPRPAVVARRRGRPCDFAAGASTAPRYGTALKAMRGRCGFITPAGLEPDTRSDVFMHADDVREGYIVKHGDSVVHSRSPPAYRQVASRRRQAPFRSPSCRSKAPSPRGRRILWATMAFGRNLTTGRRRYVRYAPRWRSPSCRCRAGRRQKGREADVMDAEAKARRPRGVFNLVPRGFYAGFILRRRRRGYVRPP